MTGQSENENGNLRTPTHYLDLIWLFGFSESESETKPVSLQL